ncbi:recombinase family protein [Streptomyces sp. NPDC101227]|uniref:recombinase family protein n=1 Tax=Streptomyces sp. NPDC101227 TaxID=3366136 RepID=UPI00381687A1
MATAAPATVWGAPALRMVLRPEFCQLLADLAHDVLDGVIFYGLDRLVRRPRDLEDLIDIVEYRR